MTIAAGQKLPDATFKTMTADGARDLTTADVFAGKTVILFGVPGAFTPTCNNNHLPGYLDNFDAITARGVDTIAVIATNDVHVMGAWARFTGGEGKLLYLADGSGDFARATGLDVDLSQNGMGLRNKRFSLIAVDGVVKAINVETKPGVNESGAATILEQL
ncbi:peroxiredoxin [Mesorhizobium marinum]|uniref:Glutathione-dependent peroxiredoxin n=1 Tax=Mesorhizobium marinum TaxID=3228790 RepID=A0ABV3R0S0_9HYPH